jgi:hypothetical protein
MRGLRNGAGVLNAAGSLRLPHPSESAQCSTHPIRAYVKIIGVASLLGLGSGALITLISRETVNDLRRHLTLWLIIGLVIAINIAAYLIFAIVWAICRSIKKDLEPEEEP